MDIRSSFLNYFSKNRHQIYESMPLVPDDPSLLFTNAGMVQFKDVFTGKVPIPPNPKATSCQLCIRAGGKHNDLENVGYTSRHHTLFEMLGNFSFGDYFKEEAIFYAWEFVTKDLSFDKNRLYVTVHDSDDEAFELWKKHIPEDRIKKMGDKDNFWQMGESGACGPCSEIFVDQGENYFNSSEDYLGGDGDRFLEIWNLVFMQYERDISGKLIPLPKPSIDTGMGLERVVALKEGKRSNFDSSLFMPLIDGLSEIVKKEYIYSSGASFRVIADHIRSISFLLAQGVNFDKEGRGYVLRRILRRAIRHGYLLGRGEPFLHLLVDILASQMGSHYSYLEEKKEVIKDQIKLEEERFFSTISGGMEMFKKELEKSSNIFDGNIAFKLYDTYGFPLDLTEDMLKDRGISIDKESFNKAMSEQRNRSKSSWKGSGDSENSGDFSEILKRFGENVFVGYDTLEYSSNIVALMDEEFRLVNKIDANCSGYVFLDKTPFYAQSGGQCGDSGVLKVEGEIVAKVVDTKNYFNLNISEVRTNAELKEFKISSVVDRVRFEIEKHHSATHLLHSALRAILGDHVAQAGSLVQSNRLRFDFSHPQALSKKEIEEVECFVNSAIAKNIDAKIEEVSISKAKERGAMALFGEKYGDLVRVVEFDDLSIELCGGCHVRNSAHIGSFFITKESGVSAGVRRIEALCGQAAYGYAREYILKVKECEELVKNSDLVVGIERLKSEIKDLKSEINSLSSSSSVDIKSTNIAGVELFVDHVEAGDIKQIIDDLKNRHPKVAVMLFQKREEKILLAAGVKNCDIKAGAWVKEIAPILGGGGGGRDDFAQAGGKDPSRLEDAITEAKKYAKERLS